MTLNTEYCIYRVLRTESTAYTKYRIHPVLPTLSDAYNNYWLHWGECTLSTAYTEYCIQWVLHTPCTSYNKYCIHWVQHYRMIKCLPLPVSISAVISHVSCIISHVLTDLILLNSLHSHSDQVMIQYTFCSHCTSLWINHPQIDNLQVYNTWSTTESNCISTLPWLCTRSASLSSQWNVLQVHFQSYSVMRSNFASSSPSSVSPNLHNDGFALHSQTHLVMASKYSSEFPNSEAQCAWLNLHGYNLTVSLQTCWIMGSKFICQLARRPPWSVSHSSADHIVLNSQK
jgi:hypothetical protein